MTHTEWIVDASVAVKRFLIHEEFSEYAVEFFEAYERGELIALAVPEHFHVECANVFWKSVVRMDLPKAGALRHLDILAELEFEVVRSRSVRRDAMEIAWTCGISVYDALYLALAKSLKRPLLTADAKLVRAARERLRFDGIVPLADWASAAR